MRIRRLNLERFGQFTDKAFDFGTFGERPDFHIIYGPNEAGKTTTMEAALRLFFGFPLREDYAFKHQRSNLQVSATLEIDGATRHFSRLPKRSGSLVDEVGTVLPETALSAHLAGLSEDDYRRLLCLDDETIERGGEEIANARGDIGRLLFSASAGVADLSNVLDGVRDVADAIWKKRGRTTRVAELKRALTEVERRVKDRDVTVSAWKALKRDLAEARKEEQGARQDRDAMLAARAQLQAKKRALPVMAEIDELEAKTAPLSAYPEQLGFDPERLIELRSDHGTASQNVDRLTNEIAALEQQRDGISVNAEQDRLAAALDELADLSARDRAARLDLGKRQGERHEAEAAMAHIAQELGLSGKSAPGDLALSAADIATLESARDSFRTASDLKRSEAREVAELQNRLVAAEKAVEAQGFDRDDVPGMANVLLRFDADNLAPQHAAALQAIHAARLNAERSLAALTVGSVTFQQLPVCPVPRALTARWAERHEELRRDIRIVTEKRDEHRADIAARQAQVETLTNDTAIVPDEKATELLATRQERWTAHLETLDAVTAEAFHEAMRQYDLATELRLNQSGELGRLRQIGEARAEAQARADQADERLKTLKDEMAEVEQSVRDAASQVGLGRSMAPAAWLEWVGRHETASAAAQDLGETQDTKQQVLQRAQALLAELAALLPFEPVDLDSALNAARLVAEDERRKTEARNQAEKTVQQVRRDLAKREARYNDACIAKGKAGENWRILVSELLGDAVSPDALLPALDALRELREHDRNRAAAERRVTAMQADQAQFASEVERLARANELEMQATAAETYGLLRDLAEQARAAQDAVAELGRKVEEAKTERSSNTEKLRRIKHEVEAIAAVFPDPDALTDIDQLRQAAARGEQVIEDRSALSKLRFSIMSELAVADMADARAQLADQTTAGLDAGLDSNESDLEHAEGRLTTAIQDRVTAENALSEVKGDSEIAALVEEKATLELQLEDAAMDRLELSLGHSLASDAIRRYRDSHRSGMMTATERYFADLTRGAYPSLITQVEKDDEILLAIDKTGASKRVTEMSKGTRFQLYLALRAAAYDQLGAQGTRLPFFCDDVFETFDEERTSAACRIMEAIGGQGQAIYLTHHRHVVEIAKSVCDTPPVVHEF